MTNRLLINSIESSSHAVASIMAVRIESEHAMQNCMVWLSGSLPASIGGSSYGFPVRVATDRMSFETDIDSRLFPNGGHELKALLWKLADNSLIAELSTQVTIDNDALLTTRAQKPAIPHFCHTGIAYQFDAKQSLIPIAMFGSNWFEFANRPGLIEAYKAAGFNALFAGIGINHIRDNPSCTQEQFEQAQRDRIDPVVSLCREHDLVCIADQMDWAANAAYVSQIMSKPWSVDAVRNTLAYMDASGVFCGIDLCDETSFRWTKEQMSIARSMTEPSIITGAFTTRRVGPPQCWTTPGQYNETGSYRIHQWYEGAYFSDYLSIGCGMLDWAYYSNPTIEFGGPSIDQSYRGMVGAFARTRKDCPTITNITACGANLKDWHSLAMMGYSIVLGATAIKVFALDTETFRSQGIFGCAPDAFPLLWQGLSHGNNAIKELTPLILQPQAACKTGGKWLATRAWEGLQGRLWMAVSRLNSSQLASIPDGYDSGYVLGLDGRHPIDMNCNQVEVPPGGWIVLTRWNAVLSVPEFTGAIDGIETAEAWSISRRLSSDYNGPIITVKRSSDGTTKEIVALASGDLDTAALLAFCGAGDGFVETTFGQNGTGHNLTAIDGQQPRIVHDGALETKNGRPVARAVGPAVLRYTGQVLARQSIAVAASDNTVLVHDGLVTDLTTNAFTIGHYNNTNLWAGEGQAHIFNGAAFDNGNTAPMARLKIIQSTLMEQAALDGVQVFQDRVYGRQWAGPIAELILLKDSIHPADERRLRMNQARYYRIENPLGWDV